MILCQFHYKEEISVFRPNFSNSSLNGTNNSIDVMLIEFKEIVKAKPTWLQYLLSFWIFTFFCEEIRQVYIYKLFKNILFFKFILVFERRFINKK
jgi:hypothetical protein